ncbi:nicotinate phosphoribosyltransferase [Nostoc sp. FACHB-973]|uniref:Nicotinate phosphoribosyltransferase n=1 Tax=Desmonostoc muscorum LEGE 12446 TaxID=1828758 RepID=A0A8J7DE04_DESMC|nr:nicotinate phosphoribosyltransferase [Desmonostoc muscorum]MBD2515575.1 nicotinate phosphoribosyltransferase [Nostoc sp. FACHB-973]MBX9256997.1 nicotinate phosphoribosyltransferase [Desmonostoc muscorum CCALA 125]MCF2151674.1 nicotinate phosphoribosyltransferase [Desmonostoc muscorum LEGE 12446]
MTISNISQMIANVTQYISEAAMRIFGPNDDAYPTIGVQPFTGEPYKKGTAETW